MSLTLVEYARTMPLGGERSMVNVWADEHPLWSRLPIETKQSGIWSQLREQRLPEVGFRKINAEFAESTGEHTEIEDRVAIVGGDCDVDEALIERGYDLDKQHVMKVKALSWAAGNAVMNGDSLSNVASYDGLKKRLDYSRTTLGQILSEGGTDGGDALQASSLDILTSMVKGVNALIMTRAVLNLITAGSRTPAVMGNVQFEPAALGGKVATWNGIPILVIDPVDAHTVSLAFDELGGSGSTATATSIYAVRFGIGGFFGFQVAPMRWNPNVPMSTTKRRGRLSWQLGVTFEDIFSVARLRNIGNLAMVA